MRLILVAALAVVVVGVSGAGAGSKSAATSGAALVPIGGSPDYVAGELIVRFRSGASATERAATLAAEGARAAGGLGLPGLTRVKLSPGTTVAEAAEALEDDPDVLYAEPNYIRRLDRLSNDPLLKQLWGLSQYSDKDIDAPSAWNHTTGSSGVVVAVIDSGIAYNHPDLNGNIWSNTDEIPGNGLDDDVNGFIDDV
ncbi:MAG TPA: S8 family serine peptidase, partial [Gaiellaceae bacterium]|nr:S8 family serine peptidase [Gaiellaceae bacterium]